MPHCSFCSFHEMKCGGLQVVQAYTPFAKPTQLSTSSIHSMSFSIVETKWSRMVSKFVVRLMHVSVFFCSCFLKTSIWSRKSSNRSSFMQKGPIVIILWIEYFSLANLSMRILHHSAPYPSASTLLHDVMSRNGIVSMSQDAFWPYRFSILSTPFFRMRLSRDSPPFTLSWRTAGATSIKNK